MNSRPECFECGQKQCERIVQLCGGGEETLQRVREQLGEMRRELDLSAPPSTYTAKMLVATMELVGNSDPFRSIREEQNRRARDWAEMYDAELEKSSQPLKMALALAAAGNVIDVGPRHRFDFEENLARCGFANDDSSLLFERLKRANRLVYILDNAGEALFDQLVLKRLSVPELTIVARSTPILNDLTVEEARQLGFERFGRVIGTGSRYLGIDLATVSQEFRQAYYEADVVIAKGHANFESLVDDGRDGFYLLTAKCELVAQRLGVGLGESVLYYAAGRG
ncbi:MAG: damage-control phosphatase ARMT1 family protein [bacterium]